MLEAATSGPAGLMVLAPGIYIHQHVLLNSDCCCCCHSCSYFRPFFPVASGGRTHFPILSFPACFRLFKSYFGPIVFSCTRLSVFVRTFGLPSTISPLPPAVTRTECTDRNVNYSWGYRLKTSNVTVTKSISAQDTFKCNNLTNLINNQVLKTGT